MQKENLKLVGVDFDSSFIFADYTKGKNQFKEIAIKKYTKTHQLYVRLAWEQKWTSQPTIRLQ